MKLENPSFEQWLQEAISNGEQECASADDLVINQYVTRFNNEIGTLVPVHGERTIATAVWFIYGLMSQYALIAAQVRRQQARVALLESVRTLYTDGFAVYCSQHFGHLDGGPEPARPLNSACYMLWDMNGIECTAYEVNGGELGPVLALLEFVLSMDHLACQESALHGLGHLANDFSSRTSPIIQSYVRRHDIHPVLRDYARNAESGCVQ